MNSQISRKYEEKHEGILEVWTGYPSFLGTKISVSFEISVGFKNHLLE